MDRRRETERTSTQCIILHRSQDHQWDAKEKGRGRTGLQERSGNICTRLADSSHTAVRYAQLHTESQQFRTKCNTECRTHNSSTQSSPLKPWPALTFSSQCRKCSVAALHLADSSHSSRSAGRI